VKLKPLIADVICYPLIGRLLGWLSDNHMHSKGLEIDTSCPAIGGRTRAEVFWGIYEGGEMRMLNRHFIPDLPVIELGSGIGVTSSFMAKRLNPDKKLVSVEADPRLIDSIRQNIQANSNGCNSVVINAAIDYSVERGPTVQLQLGESHLLSKIADKMVSSGFIDVPPIRLHTILSEHVVGPIQLVMDIEGAEVGLIRRDAESLTRCFQIIAELHDTEFEGRRISADSICQELCEKFDFEVIDQRAMVFVLRRRDFHPDSNSESQNQRS
jgi:FkbM family methyltransferase